MTDYLAFVFWALAALILYTYVGFPLTLLCVGAARRHGVQKRPITPNISLIIAAYNEQQSIAQKLNNSLDLDYPHDALLFI
ncbi:MAG: glycosyltransferase family 2 protein, partial [Gammaproteobacteria bacterium]|nr:glycosyltransferase family 2 protein [Gammaproteobacteria bacterium]